MNEVVLEWLSRVVKSRDFEGPVVKFGMLQVAGQEGSADLRGLFPGKEFVGCDLFDGPGVDRKEDLQFSHFAPDSIGTVLCIDALEHVERPWEAVQEIFRILKPGGSVLISMPFRFPLHLFPGDYWRATASGLEALLKYAGFTEIATSDSGEEVEWDAGWDRPAEQQRGAANPQARKLGFPHAVFAVGTKTESEGRAERRRELSGPAVAGVPTVRDADAGERFGGRVPIVMVLFQREEDTKEVLLQLDRVTDNYELIVVDNGFDDPGFISSLEPAAYIKNEQNVGVMRGVNQALEVTDAPYIAVLHSDLLIYDEGWLDHIIDFMERRPDVGIVGLAGRHGIDASGAMDNETTIVEMRGYPGYFKPTWRFTEIAAIDGLGWVMRNIGLRLEESFGLMHYYDLDLSLQYIERGYRVYFAAVEVMHIADMEKRSSRNLEAYLHQIGGDDDAYYDRVREAFARKWGHMLPIVRGYRDERYGYERLDAMLAETTRASEHIAFIEREIAIKNRYIQDLEGELDRVSGELEETRRGAGSHASGSDDARGEGSPSPTARVREVMKRARRKDG